MHGRWDSGTVCFCFVCVCACVWDIVWHNNSWVSAMKSLLSVCIPNKANYLRFQGATHGAKIIKGAPLCHQHVHNSGSLRCVNNWSCHLIFLKVEENKDFPLVFTQHAHFSPPPSFPLPEGLVREPLNRSVSFFLVKKHFSSLIGLCVVYVAPALKSLLSQMKKEGEEGVTNRSGDWPDPSCATLYPAAYLCTFLLAVTI